MAGVTLQEVWSSRSYLLHCPLSEQRLCCCLHPIQGRPSGDSTKTWKHGTKHIKHRRGKKKEKKSACWNSPNCPLKVNPMLCMCTVCLLCFVQLLPWLDGAECRCGLHCGYGVTLFVTVHYCTVLIIVLPESALYLYKLPYLDSLCVLCDTFCYSVLVYSVYHSFNWKRIIQVTLLNVHKIQLHLIAQSGRLKIILTCCERSCPIYHQVLKFKEAKEQRKSHLKQRERFS